MPRQRLLILILAVVLLLGVGGGLSLLPAARQAPPPVLSGTWLSQPLELGEFALIDQNGQTFDAGRLRGQWTFVFFGYTHCPDVCPTTLAELAAVERRLAAQGDDADVGYLLVTVDPERDTPARLKQYLAAFNDKFQGATGPRPELDRLTRRLGAYYSRSPHQDHGGHYQVDHAATLYLVGPDARLHAVFSPPRTPEALAADLAALRRFQ